jgi:hypothetical protein
MATSDADRAMELAQERDDLAARLAEAEAKVARVEALAQSLSKESRWSPPKGHYDLGYQDGAESERSMIYQDLRRALDGPR